VGGRCNGRVVGKCRGCSKLQAKKDAERQVAEAEAMGQEGMLTGEDITQVQEPELSELASDWCCMFRVLSLQEDFATEKPMLQRYIKGRGHICMFLPKFHCELNPIKMVWGYMKYCECSVSHSHPELISVKAIVLCLMASWQWPNDLCHNAWPCATLPQFVSSFENCGSTWMFICVLCFLVLNDA
jgi:hypothetical protein